MTERSRIRPRVRDLMRRDVVSVGPDATIPDLARLLRDREVSGVPVVDAGGGVLGTVSVTDLLWLSDRLLPASGMQRREAPPGDLPDTVRDIMTPDAFGIGPDATVDELLTFFSRTGLHRALVLDDARVVGVVSMTDLLDLVAGEGSPGPMSAGPPARRREDGVTVRDVMISDPLTVEPEATLRSAADTLTSAGVSGAPVVSQERVVGVVSLTDILAFEADAPGVPTYRPELLGVLDEDPLEAPELLDEPTRWFVDLWEDAGADVATRIDSEGPEWDRLDAHTVAEVMTRGVIGIAPTASIAEAARLMEDRRVHRLLVLDDGELLGLITTWDVMRTVARRPPSAVPAVH